MNSIFAKKLLFFLFSLFIINIPVMAENNKCAPIDNNSISQIKKKLSSLSNNIKVLKVSKSPIKNVYEIIVETPKKKFPLYIDCHLKYLITGEIIDIKRKKSLTREKVTKLNKSKNKLLFQAVKNGDLDKIKRLLSEGANVNAKDYYGKTPLHYAVDKGYLNIAKYLISKGANVNAKDDYGWTPLYYAFFDANLDMVKYLISKGANVNAKDDYGKTPLHYSDCRYLDVIKYLIKKGADVNARDKYGHTPLNYVRGKYNDIRYEIDKNRDLEKSLDLTYENEDNDLDYLYCLSKVMEILSSKSKK